VSRGVVVSVRFPLEEVHDLCAAAEAEGSTLSSYIRGVVSRETLARKPGAQRCTTPSGAPVVVWVEATTSV
jgi:hypothetical protein